MEVQMKGELEAIELSETGFWLEKETLYACIVKNTFIVFKWQNMDFIQLQG